MASDAPLYLRSLSFCNRSDFCPLHDSLASWFSSLNFHKYVDKQGKDSMRCTERQLEPLACEWWSLSGSRETFPENVPMPEEKACIPDNWFCISVWLAVQPPAGQRRRGEDRKECGRFTQSTALEKIWNTNAAGGTVCQRRASVCTETHTDSH